MPSEQSIRVEGLSKLYRIGVEDERSNTLAGEVLRRLEQPLRNFRRLRSRSRFDVDGTGAERADQVWALKDVSFEVNRGEVVGVIGHNGAGKSTALKVLSRITYPTAGRVVIDGRVSSLLEVGTGFHPELTGRENVYLNGSILGMSRAEIDAKFDEIVDFAQVEKFIDTPVKFYSSGMGLRLGFAVAAYLEPEIMLIDEILAVGDAAFQRRCLGKMEDVARGGRTVLFVSHNMAAVSNLCDRVIWFNHGRIAQDGPAQEVISAYLNSIQENQLDDLAARSNRKGTGRFRFEKIWLSDRENRPISTVKTGQGAVFHIAYRGDTDAPLNDVQVAINILDLSGGRLLTLATRLTGQDFARLGPSGVLACDVDRISIIPGLYRVNLWSTVEGYESDVIEDAFNLVVEDGDFYGSGATMALRKHGALLTAHHWSVVEAE